MHSKANITSVQFESYLMECHCFSVYLRMSECIQAYRFEPSKVHIKPQYQKAT